MIDDYLWDPRSAGVAPDAEVERLERLLARFRHADGATPRWERETRRARPWIVAALAAAALVVLWLALRERDALHWRVEGLAGCERLRAGEALENRTGRDVRVAIGALGEVIVADGARLLAEDCGAKLHSLRLERGRVHARITAAPRVFQIDTPSGRTIDLGCEYDLVVDDSGAARVRVTSGQIEFVLDGREVYVPAGASCAARPGEGPGFPEFDERSNALSDVLVIATGAKEVAMKDPQGFFDALLSECTDEDTLTLWHLFDAPAGESGAGAMEEEHRKALFERLARQFPFPAGVTAEGVLANDRAMRRAWRDSMQPAWRIAYQRR